MTVVIQRRDEVEVFVNENNRIVIRQGESDDDHFQLIVVEACDARKLCKAISEAAKECKEAE